MNSEVSVNKVYKNKVVNKYFVSLIIGYMYFCVAFLMCNIIFKEDLKTGMYYCSIILSAIFFAKLAQNSKVKFGFNIFISLSFLILFFNLGFRNYSGIDDPAYIRIFNDVLEYGWIHKFLQTKTEPGYLILNYVVGIFTDEYIYMQAISSFIALALFYYSFSKYRYNINLPMSVFLLSTMIYFQMLSASLVRMFIAMGIVFNSYYYLLNRDYKRFNILILIAALFHYSALFMLILNYFKLNGKSIEKNNKEFIILSIILIPIIFIIIAKVVVPILGNRHSGYGNIGTLKIAISSFDTLPILILMIFNRKYIEDCTQIYYKLFITLFALSSVISVYSSMVSVGRIIYYTNSAIFILGPMISKKLRGTARGLIFDGIMVLYGFVYVFWTQFMLQSAIPYLFPYQNIFFNI